MKRLFLYTGLVLAILLLALVSVSLWLVMSTGARVARQRAAITAAGDKLYLTEYAREPLPDEDNAYYYLKQANAGLEAFNEQYGEITGLDLTHRLRPDQIETLAKLVDEHEATYDLIEQAATCSQFDAQPNYSQGFMAALPHLTEFRSILRALSAKALVLAYRGEGDAALSQCEQAFRLTAHLESEPLLISHLISVACQAIAVQASNHVLRIAEASPDARQRLDAALAAIDNQRAYQQSLKCERALGVQMFAEFRKGKADLSQLAETPTPLSWTWKTWIGQAILNDDEAKYIELMTYCIEAAETTAAERQVKANTIAELDETGVRYPLTRMFIPAVASARQASERGDTLNHTLRVLLALRNDQPTTLDQVKLPASAKLDAEGRPLIFRMTDEGWLVYGLGKNGVDDGGTFEVSSGHPPDIGLGPLGDPLPVEADLFEADAAASP